MLRPPEKKPPTAEDKLLVFMGISDGVPENPSGWLFRAARNRALDVVRR